MAPITILNQLYICSLSLPILHYMDGYPLGFGDDRRRGESKGADRMIFISTASVDDTQKLKTLRTVG